MLLVFVWSFRAQAPHPGIHPPTSDWKYLKKKIYRKHTAAFYLLFHLKQYSPTLIYVALLPIGNLSHLH